MDERRRMAFVALVLVVLVASAAPLLGQGPPGQKPRILVWVPEGRYLVRADVWLAASSDSLYVPFCGKAGSAEFMPFELCGS